MGGWYNPNATTGSLIPEDSTSALQSSLGSAVTLSNSSDPGLRTVESDNLTNFHNGKLD